MTDATELTSLARQLATLRAQAVDYATEHAADVAAVHPEERASAANLLHYLALRRHDLRPLQDALADLGLSSLGRGESHVLAALDQVLDALARMGADVPPVAGAPVNRTGGQDLLERHTADLLGAAPASRAVRIMVTMPASAATDERLIPDLLAAGMDLMRINAAHDGPPAWAAMLARLRAAERDSGRACRVQIDLAGPKLRTTAVRGEQEVASFGPRHDETGAVLRPARVWLTPAAQPAPPPEKVDVILPVAGDVLRHGRAGDALELLDCRWRHRKVRLLSEHGGSWLAQAVKRIYVAEGAPVRLRRAGRFLAHGHLQGLAVTAAPLLVAVGDTLVLCRNEDDGRAPLHGDDGRLLAPAQIGCTLGAAFDSLRSGETILFDDGRIAGEILVNNGPTVSVRITRTPPGGGRLRGDQGINLPDSALALPCLSDADLEALDFAVAHADMVGLSFVRSPADVLALERELAARHGQHLGVVLKIETREGFEQLPRILLAALRSPPVGIMIARGDLAAEIGFERLAEIQEEILWLCEAAHLPVIWATQVLETLAKQGFPSRAEVTDAAMSVRAECVMLNKGPYIVQAVEFLDGVLTRMQAHQHKKTSMLRKLAVAED